MEAMKTIYSNLYSREIAEFLVNSIRSLMSKQYQAIWSSFCSFLRSRDPVWITEEIILSYIGFLFSAKNLAPATLSSYRSALAKPLLLAFNVNVTSQPFIDMIRACFNLRPSLPARRFSWSLDRVLDFILTYSYHNSSVVEYSLMCSSFLLVLASGRLVSELNSFLRS